MKELEEMIAVKPGITAREHVSSWYNPRENGGLILEGLDDEDRPFRLHLTYKDLKRMVEWLEGWIAKREKEVKSMR